MKSYNTIDAHVAGEAVRLIVGGAPSVAGRTMADKLAWIRRHGDAMRRALMLEPRGHSGMHGALLTEPVSPRAHAGLLSMHAGGYAQVSGEGLIAAITIALEDKIIHSESEELLFDTPAGAVRARPGFDGDAVTSVTLTGVPSFVHSAGLAVQLGPRSVRVDVAFGGELYAIADSESAGVPVDLGHADQLIRVGAQLKAVVEAAIAGAQLDGVIFTAPAAGAADLRSATILHDATQDANPEFVLRRSPGVAGSAAILAVLDAMGVIEGDQTFAHEGIVGTVLRGWIARRQHSGERPTVTPVVQGSAWMTGRHEFVVEDDDPMT